MQITCCLPETVSDPRIPPTVTSHCMMLWSVQRHKYTTSVDIPNALKTSTVTLLKSHQCNMSAVSARQQRIALYKTVNNNNNNDDDDDDNNNNNNPATSLQTASYTSKRICLTCSGDRVHTHKCP